MPDSPRRAEEEACDSSGSSLSVPLLSLLLRLTTLWGLSSLFFYGGPPRSLLAASVSSSCSACRTRWWRGGRPWWRCRPRWPAPGGGFRRKRLWVEEERKKTQGMRNSRCSSEALGICTYESRRLIGSNRLHHPSLASLHWLSVRFGTDWKVLLITFKTHLFTCSLSVSLH